MLLWKKVSPGLGSCSELVWVRDEKTEGLCVVFFSFVRRLEQLVTTLIYQLEKENMTTKGSLLNSVSGQDRLQETAIVVPLGMQKKGGPTSPLGHCLRII